MLFLIQDYILVYNEVKQDRLNELNDSLNKMCAIITNSLATMDNT